MRFSAQMPENPGTGLSVLLNLCTSFGEADALLTKHAEDVGFKTYGDRIRWLEDNYNCGIVGSDGNDRDDYVALLTAVVESKWR